jgi:hypothetical protein
MRKKTNCSTCGVPFSQGFQRAHEKGAWHRNYELIAKAIKSKMNKSEIARLIDRPASYVSYYMKLNGGK